MRFFGTPCIYLFIYSFIYLSIYLYIYSFIYLFYTFQLISEIIFFLNLFLTSLDHLFAFGKIGNQAVRQLEKIFIFRICPKLILTFPINHPTSFLGKLALNEV